MVRNYTLNFHGRLKGALGIWYGCTKTVEADSFEAARLKLYDTHEHISGVREINNA